MRVMGRRKQASLEAMAKHHADVGLAEKFDGLLTQAQEAEQALRAAQANRAPDEELHRLGMGLDGALTDVMRAAYAAQRAAIGPLGYDDRIYRRKAMATPKVRTWTMEAERLLTLRESHRLTGIVRLPHPAGPDPSDAPGGADVPPHPSVTTSPRQDVPPRAGTSESSGDRGVLPRAAGVS
jgi:hypothetical protein